MRLTIAKKIILFIVICIMMAIDALFCFEWVVVPASRMFHSESNSDYDSFPEYSGVVEEIEAIGGDVFTNNNYPYTTDTVVFVIPADSGDGSEEPEYENVDCVEIGKSNSYISPKTARIKVSGPDGERWFVADDRTVIYGSVADSRGLADIKVGQTVTFGYGTREDIEGYDFVYAIKGKVPLRRYSSLVIQYVLVVFIPNHLLSLCSVYILFEVTEAFADIKKRYKTIIIFFVVVIVLLAIAWFGIDRYLKAANAAASSITVHAPIIYLYTESDEPVNVQLDLEGDLTVTYPEYVPDEGWTVTASPDGTLTDSDGNTYPFLFWEGDLNMDYDLSHGYCVKGCDTEEFLDCALAQLGLTETEAADFKAYWLPLMEGNSYNVITFQTTAYDDAVSHTVTPEPDTVIRVNMLWYASDTEVDIEPQDISGMNPMPEEREGFVFVEWGGEAITPYDN